MEIKKLTSKIRSVITKYKYTILILIIGIALIKLPIHLEKNTDTQPNTIAEPTEPSINQQLGEILSQIHGAGKVQVMLTVASGAETFYQTDNRTALSEQSSSTQSDTVIITDAERNQVGLIKQINPPVYQGALIVCQGADSASVRLAIVEAVAKVTGLSTDRICVMKMK